jgi:hypothetical protein
MLQPHLLVMQCIMQSSYPPQHLCVQVSRVVLLRRQAVINSCVHQKHHSLVVGLLSGFPFTRRLRSAFYLSARDRCRLRESVSCRRHNIVDAICRPAPWPSYTVGVAMTVPQVCFGPVARPYNNVIITLWPASDAGQIPTTYLYGRGSSPSYEWPACGLVFLILHCHLFYPIVSFILDDNFI